MNWTTILIIETILIVAIMYAGKTLMNSAKNSLQAYQTRVETMLNME